MFIFLVLIYDKNIFVYACGRLMHIYFYLSSEKRFSAEFEMYITFDVGPGFAIIFNYVFLVLILVLIMFPFCNNIGFNFCINILLRCNITI